MLGLLVHLVVGHVGIHPRLGVGDAQVAVLRASVGLEHLQTHGVDALALQRQRQGLPAHGTLQLERLLGHQGAIEPGLQGHLLGGGVRHQQAVGLLVAVAQPHRELAGRGDRRQRPLDPLLLPIALGALHPGRLRVAVEQVVRVVVLVVLVPVALEVAAGLGARGPEVVAGGGDVVGEGDRHGCCDEHGQGIHGVFSYGHRSISPEDVPMSHDRMSGHDPRRGARRHARAPPAHRRRGARGPRRRGRRRLGRQAAAAAARMSS